jgi:Rrf2 family iron-sulfur cluster assembly transcriptional regulator
MSPSGLDQNSMFKITSRGKHAVSALVDLASADNKSPVPLSGISERSKISLSYLEQLFAALRRHGLVSSTRGPGGGYKLAKNTRDITITSILKAAEDTISAKRSHETEQHHITNDQSKALWICTGRILELSLDKITLQDVLSDKLDTHPFLNKVFETLQ